MFQAIKELLEYDLWISTYSYRGWCQNWDPVECQGEDAGPWADCMTSPCEVVDDSDRPLSCRCTVNVDPFVGTNGSCDDENPETVMFTIERFTLDFKNNGFPFPGRDMCTSREPALPCHLIRC